MMPERSQAMRTVLVLIALLLAEPALAEPAGPPVPPVARLTPAEQAIAYVHRSDALPPAPALLKCHKANGEPSTACGVKEGARPPSMPCRRRSGEIVICAPVGRSPDRIPLPNERGPAHHPGEFAKPDAGDGPLPVKGGITVATFGMSRQTKMRNATLKLIYAQERAAQAAADQAKRDKEEAEEADLDAAVQLK